MKAFVVLLSTLLLANAVHAIAIDEAGSSRPKKKPRATLVINLSGDSKEAAYKNMLALIRATVRAQSEISVELDLDGDGKTEMITMDAKEEDLLGIAKGAGSASATRLTDERRTRTIAYYTADKTAHGIGNSRMELILEEGTETEHVGRGRPGKTKFKNIVLRIADPSPETLRKGWDGTVKGGSKKVIVRGWDPQKKALSVEAEGALDKVELCTELCGATDHF